ncbi:hypothetical protein NKH69_09375 [Mesorhizobium sp. M0976]|uniref:hypothetical protein n=1 Tax=unclassified Mesorhizobium TaxID=325217 RepID=UPI00333A4812
MEFRFNEPSGKHASCIATTKFFLEEHEGRLRAPDRMLTSPISNSSVVGQLDRAWLSLKCAT